MENYEQKYKNAIEALGNLLKRAKDEKWALVVYSSKFEEIFPELAESEDEKIRKDLIEFVNQYGDKFYGTIAKASAISWLEKQKPTDEVKPKFKVGDWVVCCKMLYQIEKVTDLPDNHFQYWTTDGVWFGDGTKAHLWTIQDAKDGDVLEFGDHGRLVVGIVHYINKSTGKVDVYCLLEDNNFKVGIYYALDTIKPHPASKEQRDMLLQKMKEAGYEWNAEKKELKKIEQKPVEWSEEDEHRRGDAIYFLETAKKNYASTIEIDATINWLKSLKHQPHWKPTERQLQALRYALGDDGNYDKIALQKLHDDLKNL